LATRWSAIIPCSNEWELAKKKNVNFIATEEYHESDWLELDQPNRWLEIPLVKLKNMVIISWRSFWTRNS
jgi:hypothetical protein